MRVLVLVPSFPLEADLFGHAVAEQLRALLDRHALRIQSLKPLRRDRSVSHGLEVFSTGGGRARRLMTMFARHRRWRPDIVWGMWADRSGPAALALGRLLGAPVLISLMGGEVARLPDIGYGGARTSFGRAKLRWVFRSARVITVGSRWLAPRLLGLATPPRWLETPVGVRADGIRTRTAAPWKAGSLRLCAISHAHPVKGVKHVFLAVRSLRDRGLDAHLTLYTLDPDDGRKRLVQMARAAGVFRWVEISEPVSAPALYQRLHRFDALVSGSLHESQGLSLIEAALAQVPVVALSAGVADELAAMGAAWIAPAPHELAPTILRAAHSAPRARAAVARKFDLATCTARFDRALRLTAA